jgi:hypothetical protein
MAKAIIDAGGSPKITSMKMLDTTVGTMLLMKKIFLNGYTLNQKKQNNEIQQNIININFIFNRYE